MALTPEDVVNKRFQPTKFREGYDQDEVDDFLDEIVVELRRLHQENDDLRKQLAQAEANTGAAPAKAAPLPVKEAPVVEKAAAPEPEAPKPVVPEPVVAAPVAAPAPAPAATDTAESATGVIALAQRLHDEYVNSGVEQRDKIIA